MSTSPKLQDLSLDGCSLSDALGANVMVSWFTQNRGVLSLEDNMLSGQLFSLILSDKEYDETLEIKEPLICQKVSLSRNKLVDLGADFGKVLKLKHVRVCSLDLSGNSLDKRALVYLREFLETTADDLAFEQLNLTNNNLSLLKSASILEMRQRGSLFLTVVTYTKEQPKKIKKQIKKKSKKLEK